MKKRNIAIEKKMDSLINGTTSGSEIKTARITLIVLPSVRSDLDKIAAVERRSLNDVVSSAICAYLETKTETLERYSRMFES